MAVYFNELLGRAEKLAAPSLSDQFDKSSFTQGTSDHESPLFVSSVTDSDLQSIFRASESLWNKASTANIKKNLLFGEKGVVFGVPAPQLETAVDVASPPEDSEDVEEDSRHVKLEIERSFFNYVLLSKPKVGLSTSVNKFKKDGKCVDVSLPKVSEEFVSRRDLLFGDRIRRYIRSKGKRNLGELLNSVNLEPNVDSTLVTVWTEVLAMFGGDQKIAVSRDDVTCCNLLVERACDYLQRQYRAYMKDRIVKHFEIENGDQLEVNRIVEYFLKMSPDSPDSEDGSVDGLPVWEVIYHCYRAGDLSAAASALNRLGAVPHSAILVQSLFQLSQRPTLDVETKKKLRVEWRHCTNTVVDVHKRSLYIALLGGDSPLADSVENWLWFKLTALRTDPQMTPQLYTELQKTISVDYGEAYFMENGGFQYYFTSLWLSGQFERAIELLTNCGMLSEAVHIGILTNRLGYLRKTKDTSADLIVIDPSLPTVAALNLARLIVVFTKPFELTDPLRALEYFFLLKGFKTPAGSDVFEKAVSRAVYLNSEPEAVGQILGYMTTDGIRRPGLIDEMVDDPLAVIASVAEDTELSGQCFEAVHLYLLAQRSDRATVLLASEISEALRIDLQKAQAYRQLCLDCNIQLTSAPPELYSAMSMLMDLVLVFNACEKGEAEFLYKYLQQLRLLPTDTKMVTVLTSEFHLVPQKVREVIPDLCLRTVKCLSQAVHRKPNNHFANMVRGIVLYAATVNYRFPQHITSELLRVQASIPSS